MVVLTDSAPFHALGGNAFVIRGLAALECVKPPCRHECADRQGIPDDLLVRDAMSAIVSCELTKYAAPGERYHGKQPIRELTQWYSLHRHKRGCVASCRQQ